ncbi:hypothetical protein G7046_g2446 [Stylonectria norvegica]|nr:hypothetical protein G7046_g2446 [Stylonectria norvegica]
MATPSVALPPPPDEDSAPVVFERGHGLAKEIGAAAAAAVAAAASGATAGTIAAYSHGSDGGGDSGCGHLQPGINAAAHHHTHGGRITKTRRHMTTPSITAIPTTRRTTASTPPPKARFISSTSTSTSTTTTPTPTRATASLVTPAATAGALASARPSPSSNTKATGSTTRTATRTATPTADMDPPVLSFWGPDPVPLPSRFARIKRNLIRGHEAELEASWTRLIAALRADVEHIECLGAHLIPSIEFADVDDPAQTARFGRDLKRYGVGVIRKVVPKPDADAAMRETVQYLDSKRHIKPPRQDPTCFDFFWTPAQVRSRAHPNVLCAQRFMMGLWETSPDDRLATRLPITYVDRIRIHGAGEQRPHGINVPPLEPPQSADDWIYALQSSAGIIAQVDNGSLERWEPDGYQQAGTYNHIFHGRWEDHDPWECASRVSATMDLYNGYAACTIFRMFQGVLALSTIEPGVVRLLPSPKLATAYYLLRPFFSPQLSPPESRSGPEWEAYLAPENWKLQRDPDTIIHGAVPGHAQRITEHWHPHLYLRDSMITLPTLQPGDYIFWHPDLPYHISSNNPGLLTPSSNDDDISMLVYIPAAPLTQTNALYLARQRKAFQRGHPGPDFDSTGRGTVVEDAETRPGEKDIAEYGGPAGLQAMGLAPWEVAATRAGTPPGDKPKSKGEDVEMEDGVETKSLMSTSSISRAEAEVVRLANIILFPDRSMMGYCV